ncbi:MAG: hypothetical protein OER43_03485 [Gammaproteobacteria bacterium]|nr:hypothetical protein [Gammaproteobacteria bacterium]MDH3412177.1 hypothetical protein [Gammaproteobacteria bacterium]
MELVKKRSCLLMLAFLVGYGGVALAADPSDKAIAEACKGKKAGTVVTIGGKRVDCPAPKK